MIKLGVPESTIVRASAYNRWRRSEFILMVPLAQVAEEEIPNR
jgi:hypothetical protein